MSSVGVAPSQGVEEKKIRLGSAQLQYLKWLAQEGGQARMFCLGTVNGPFANTYGYGNMLRIIKSLEKKGLITIQYKVSSYSKHGKPYYASFILLTPLGKQVLGGAKNGRG